MNVVRIGCDIVYSFISYMQLLVDALLYATFLVENLIVHLLMKKEQVKSNEEYVRATEVQTEIQSHIRRQVYFKTFVFLYVKINGVVHHRNISYMVQMFCTVYTVRASCSYIEKILCVH